MLPGTHRANLPLPSNTLDDETMFEHAVHVEMSRGDVLFFMGGAGGAQPTARPHQPSLTQAVVAGAVCHGALPWRGIEARGTVIVQYMAPPTLSMNASL